MGGGWALGEGKKAVGAVEEGVLSGEGMRKGGRQGWWG